MIKHIRAKYPDIITIAGFGEYQEYDYQRMDACLKGYNGGQPDITLLKKLNNGFTDVVAIELKNPNGSNITSLNKMNLSNGSICVVFQHWYQITMTM